MTQCSFFLDEINLSIAPDPDFPTSTLQEAYIESEIDIFSLNFQNYIVIKFRSNVVHI